MLPVQLYTFIAVSAVLVWVLGIYAPRVKPFVAPPLLIVVTGMLLELVAPLPEKPLLRALEILSWVAVGFGVTGIALRFRGKDTLRLIRPGAVVTGIAMLGMWAISGLLTAWLLGLPFWLATLIGAIITPTDPVIASSIVTGSFAEQHIPERLRYMLAFESGTNDGLAFAFVFLPILMLEPGKGWGDWLLNTILWEVIAAAFVGAALGFIAGKIAKSAAAHDLLQERGVLLASVAFTVTVLAVGKRVSADSIWAAFIGTLVFSAVLPGSQRKEADDFQEGTLYLAMVPALLGFGMALPWANWADLGLAGVALVVLVLLVRRIPVIALLYAAMRKEKLPTTAEEQQPYQFHAPHDLWFYGWFGPIGISGIYYATTAYRHLGDERIWSTASLIVFASVIAHGLSAALFTRWYGKANTRLQGNAC